MYRIRQPLTIEKPKVGNDFGVPDTWEFVTKAEGYFIPGGLFTNAERRDNQQMRHIHLQTLVLMWPGVNITTDMRVRTPDAIYHVRGVEDMGGRREIKLFVVSANEGCCVSGDG